MGRPRPSAKSEETSRTAKAQKIALLSGVIHPMSGDAMLYIGSGTGYTKAYFSKLGFGEAGTFAVDISDEKRASSGSQITQAGMAKLPFPDGRFDFIISNHVIKHLAGGEQQTHLAEIGRCLRENGKLHIAVPNRWGLIDAHYRLPLLGWLPRGLAHSYLRVTRKADRYEWHPLSRRQALGLLDRYGFHVEDVTIQAIRLGGGVERTGLLRLASGLPAWCWRLLLPVVPTLIFVCRKQAEQRQAQAVRHGETEKVDLP